MSEDCSGLLKRKLMAAIAQEITDRKLTQDAAAEILGVYQADVFMLIAGYEYRFSFVRLFRFAERLGCEVSLEVRRAVPSVSTDARSAAA